MSKAPSETDVPPPAYSTSPPQRPPTPLATPAYSSSSPLLTTHISQHLSLLPSRIRATSSQHLFARAAEDLALITVLVPHVENFLSDLGNRCGGGVAELILVPASAVPEPWALSGVEERRREGEVVQLARVQDAAAAAAAGAEKDGKTNKAADARDYSMDSWGRWPDDGASASRSTSSSSSSGWWFDDEARAKRLATYLAPRNEIKTSRRAVAEAVKEAKEQKGSSRWSGWGSRKKSAKVAEDEGGEVPSSLGVDGQPGGGVIMAGEGEDDERVRMTTRAEEVAFRKENEFGVWEGRRGWAVVVSVAVRGV